MDSKTILANNFDGAQQELLSKLLTSLNTEQKVWLGGYLSGINESTGALLQLLAQDKSIGTLAQTGTDAPQLTILFGTRTGNAQKIAKWAQSKANGLGVNANLVSLNDYNPKQIKKEKNLIVIVSTDGEGEAPVSAEEFYNYLHSKKAPKLEGVNYAVIALGDSSYQFFCKTGKDIDEKLAELGGERFAERIDLDLDFDEPSKEWIDVNLEKFAEENKVAPQNGATSVIANAQAIEYTQESPYDAVVLDKILLNGRGSSKETHHYEFSIEDSGITYTPGDALGVFGFNDQSLVNKVIEIAKLNESDRIMVGNKEKTLRDALTYNYEITRLTPPLLKAYAGLAQSKKLDQIIGDQSEFEKYLWGRDLIDLLEEFPVNLDQKLLFETLRKLQPRLYSIASSYNANPDEVHITVASVKYQHNKRLHQGVCSNYLANHVDDDTTVPIYIDENIGFRLPNDPSTPIIMIGAGTGVAPYRAFLQERELSDNAGKSWLFFGERNFTTDFMYQTEWQKFKKKGVLSNIDIAFSRDQKEKLYVQHKLISQQKEVFNWLQEGAHVYLCGDKNAMAKDVKEALIKVIEQAGGYKPDKAEEYFKQLRKQNRFQEDVY